MTLAISLKDVKFRYKGQKADTLSLPFFEVSRGEHIFIHGPSGSGKTTLLGLMSGILSPSSGTIQLLGKDFSRLSPSQRDRFRGDHLGYVFQMFNLLPFLSVADNIMLSTKFSKLRHERCLLNGGVRTNLLRIAEKLGIDGLLNRSARELSVGQQQRVAVARALLGDPEILLADEPTSALDADTKEKFLSLMFDAANQAGTTVLFVSHDAALQGLFHKSLALKSLSSLNEGTKPS